MTIIPATPPDIPALVPLVNAAYRGEGVGKHLLTAATHYAAKNNCKKIHITVISARPELIAWYERHGYQRTGEIQPFHHGEKFGIQKQPLELVVLEKPVNYALFTP